ncbi:MAG TPA: pyrimidine dimer DNA glycosylase/endonuclease V [Lacisediminihabitans sp.]|uniref:pyrimidine dimer DNA glycosylase/endonuclease V n=1 Tax=Lacisediminihabitans sp. TaxID=2787631 RepID=UPI002ED81295
MRIWSVHPRQLDRQALVACWREALLAQAVLAGRTKGYTRHPQLARFRSAPDSETLVGAYLTGLADEADRRGYHFDRTRITAPARPEPCLVVTDGQLAHEWGHLLAKLERRSPEEWKRWRDASPEPHPLFTVVPGPIADWERPGTA